MNDLLSKISSYHLFNYLLPGCLFAVVATKITHHDFIQRDLLVSFFLYYFYGLVISRIGSLALEPLLRFVRFLKFSNYAEFVVACRNDPKIDVLSESNNMYRTLCCLLLMLVALRGYSCIESRFPPLARWDMTAAVALLLALFLLSYRKQTTYITKRVKANLEAK